MIYAGTSGITLPSNKQGYPLEFQDKTRLNYYASLFNSLEVNSSFKKIPMARTVEKWAGSVPGGFRFTFKISKKVSHNKSLQFKPEDVNGFMQVISGVGDKAGCLLLQFPGKLDISELTQLENLLNTIKQADPVKKWKIAVEFRNPSWYHKNVYDLLTNYESSMVIHDMPASITPLEITGDFVYLRFHGPEKGYRGSYDIDILKKYAELIKNWTKHNKEVFVYFNNTLGAAVQNLITLKSFLESAK